MAAPHVTTTTATVKHVLLPGSSSTLCGIPAEQTSPVSTGQIPLPMCSTCGR